MRQHGFMPRVWTIGYERPPPNSSPRWRRLDVVDL
jgi:hypothetical protein